MRNAISDFQPTLRKGTIIKVSTPQTSSRLNFSNYRSNRTNTVTPDIFWAINAVEVEKLHSKSFDGSPMNMLIRRFII